MLESGRLPIYEPGLLELVERNRHLFDIQKMGDEGGAPSPARKGDFARLSKELRLEPIE